MLNYKRFLASLVTAPPSWEPPTRRLGLDLDGPKTLWPFCRCRVLPCGVPGLGRRVADFVHQPWGVPLICNNQRLRPYQHARRRSGHSPVTWQVGPTTPTLRIADWRVFSGRRRIVEHGVAVAAAAAAAAAVRGARPRTYTLLPVPNGNDAPPPPSPSRCCTGDATAAAHAPPRRHSLGFPSARRGKRPRQRRRPCRLAPRRGHVDVPTRLRRPPRDALFGGVTGATATTVAGAGMVALRRPLVPASVAGTASARACLPWSRKTLTIAAAVGASRRPRQWWRPPRSRGATAIGGPRHMRLFQQPVAMAVAAVADVCWAGNTKGMHVTGVPFEGRGATGRLSAAARRRIDDSPGGRAA